MAKRDPVASGALIAAIVIGMILFLWFIWRISSIVVIILIATVLAAGIGPLVDRMSQVKLSPRGWTMPRGLAVLLVYLTLVVLVALIVLLIGSVVVNEAVSLARNAPNYLSIAEAWYGNLQHKHTFLPAPSGIVTRLRDQLGVVSAYAYSAAARLIGFLGNIVVLVVIFVITYYLLTGEKSAKTGFLRLIPPTKRPKFDEAFTEMGCKMGAWLRGQITLAIIIGTLVSLGMWIIGVPYAALIGIVGAVAELIPMLGPSVAAVPAVLLVLFQAKWQIVVVIIFFVVLSQVESNVLFPKIMKQAVGLNPIVTILALFVGASLAGFIGALLAVPLTAAAQVFFNQIILPAIESAEEGR